MNTYTSTLIDYIRHGEPVGGKRFRGNGIDDPLSERGWQQMRDTTAGIAGWQRVVSSPMQRCVAFATWLAQQRGLPMEVIHDLREVGFGAWEGADREQLKRQRGDEYRAFYADPVNNRPHGAEPLDHLGSRVGMVFDSLVEQHAGEHLLVVAHAGVIRATIGHVTRMPAVNWYRLAVDNAAISRFHRDNQGVSLAAHNWRPSL